MPDPRPLGRRAMLRRAALTGAALAFPGAEWLDAYEVPPSPRRPVPPSPQDDWSALRRQFLIAPRGIYFNTGTVGASPRVVLDAVVRHMTAFETVFDQQGVDLATLRQSLATLLGAPAHSFAFPRNTTEAMNYAANGLDLARGGEILMTTHEHVGGWCPWALVAARHGLTIVRAELPAPARSAEQVYDAWMRRVTRRTKVAMISHVTFTNGLIQPVRELCAEFRRRGIVTVIDGAHPPGMIPVNLTELGCDIYCSSPHKWLLAPKGCGLLYVSDAWVDRLWPTIASGGWDDLALKGGRFDHVGTRNDSLFAGFIAAMEFLNQVGPERVFARIKELGDRLYDGLAQVDGVELKSASDPAIRASMISFTVRGWDTNALIQELWRRGPVRVRHVAEWDYHWVRLSTHIYNSPAEVDRVVGMVREIAAERH